MPRPPLIRDERKREWAIAAAMAALLGCAIGIAAAMSSSGGGLAGSMTARLDLDEFTLDVPQNWITEQPSPPIAGLGRQVVLFNPDEPSRRLLVGEMPLPSVQPPAAAAALAWARIHGGPAPGRAERIESNGRAVGAAVAATEQIRSPQGGLTVRQHHLAVVTRNGRSYWVVYLLSTLDGREPEGVRQREDRMLFGMILESIRFP